MFDSIFEVAANILDFFYGLVPNFAVAIILMTLLVMVVTTPLTLKGTRGMIKMQLLQPELKKIQDKHKGGDRQEMNAELMAFYQENNLNPLGGCLPLLVQAPVFLLLFRLIEGLTRRSEGTFDPKYLDHTSDLYNALDGEREMVSFGLDLSESTSNALGDSIIHGLPYLALILVMIGAQYYQQRQVSARNPDGGMAMPQQKILLRVMPAFFGVISINFAAALVVYWVTSSVYRIGLQAYITRALYAGEGSLGAQANQAAAAARAQKAAGKDKGGTGAAGKATPAKDQAPADGTDESGADEVGENGGRGKAKGPGTPAGAAETGPDRGGGNGRAAPIGGGSRVTPAGGKYQPGSKKKKKKRR